MSPAENVVKEAEEETGLIVRPLYLMAIIDSRKAGSIHRHNLFAPVLLPHRGRRTQAQSARGRWRPVSFRWINCPNRFTVWTANGSALRASFISRAARNLFRSDGLRVFDDAESAFSGGDLAALRDPRRGPHRGRRKQQAYARTDDAAPGSASSVCGSARYERGAQAPPSVVNG